MDLYVGTSGFSYKEWKGKFYPKGICLVAANAPASFYGECFHPVGNPAALSTACPGLRSWKAGPRRFAVISSSRSRHPRRSRT